MNTRQLARLCRIDQIAALDNLFLAASKARRGKSRRPDVEAWWMRREVEIISLRESSSPAPTVITGVPLGQSPTASTDRRYSAAAALCERRLGFGGFRRRRCRDSTAQSIGLGWLSEQ